MVPAFKNSSWSGLFTMSLTLLCGKAFSSFNLLVSATSLIFSWYSSSWTFNIFFFLGFLILRVNIFHFVSQGGRSCTCGHYEKGLRELFKTQFDLGAGPELAIGPLEKIYVNFQKILYKKDIYAYSTIKGLFAGVSLEGTVITSDKTANHRYYQQKVSNRNMLLGHKGVKIPESAKAFLQRLNKLAPPAS